MNTEDKKVVCKCPYCEQELKMSCFEPAFCEPCKVEFVLCKKCNNPVDKKSNICTVCGENNE